MTDRIVHFHVGRSVHPVYAEQLHALPDGFRYRYVHPGLGRRHDADQAHRRAARHAASKHAPEPKRSPLGRSPAPATCGCSTPRIADDVDLIHSAQFLLRNPPKPYVVDFEQVGVFSLYQQLALTRPWARERLRRAILDDRCKHLLPWSNAARDGLLQRRRRQRRAQGDDAPPGDPARGQHPEDPRRRAAACAVRRHRVLREGRRGGDSRRDPRGATSSSTSSATSPTSFDVPEGVTVHVPARRDLVERLYAQCHVLLFPIHMDTFGWVVIEAMAPRPAGDRARPPRAQRADRRRLRPALRAREHALRRRRARELPVHDADAAGPHRGVTPSERGVRRRDRGGAYAARASTTRSTSGSPPARSPGSRTRWSTAAPSWRGSTTPRSADTCRRRRSSPASSAGERWRRNTPSSSTPANSAQLEPVEPRPRPRPGRARGAR